MKSKNVLIVVLLGFLLGGCATSRSLLDVPIPASGASTPANGKSVHIRSTKDMRRFEANPSAPNIPSLDPSEAQGPAIQARSIGRKRNGFGKALGDILLKEGQTVESLSTASIAQAFAEKGYRLVASSAEIGADTTVVDAQIARFWSWMNPGFASITLSSEIATDLSITPPTGAGKRTHVSVRASDSFQTGMEENWIAVINKALRAYIEDLKSKID